MELVETVKYFLESIETLLCIDGGGGGYVVTNEGVNEAGDICEKDLYF